VAPVRRWLLGLVLVALLVPAATLTAVRLLDLDAGLAIRLVSFTPLALPLYAAAVLLLAVLVVVRRRTRLVLLLLPALVGLGLHAWWFAPLVSGGQPDTTGRTWTVMTSNLLAGQGDGLEVLRAATEADVDVLVLEEVTTGVVADMERAGLSERFPHHIGEARPDGQTDGTMVWSRVPLSEATRVGTDMQSWAVEVRDPDGEPFTLLAVHPAAPVDPARGVATTPPCSPRPSAPGRTSSPATSTPPSTTRRCAGWSTPGGATPPRRPTPAGSPRGPATACSRACRCRPSSRSTTS
jgi:endonuclease/exonuclease/phosphatase (EEP) superfamily protein YafD